MSLKGWIVQREIRKAAEKAEREGGAVAKLYDWLTDPAAPGRKRGIAAALVIVAASLRAGHEALLAACGDGLTSRLCSVESVGPVASVLEMLAAWLPTLDGTTTFAAAVMGLIGLWHAKKKEGDAAKKLGAGLLVLGLLAGPAAAEVTERATRTICHDGWVYTETCGKLPDGERVCTLAPLARLEAGAAVKGCSDMTVLGTVALLAAAHGADLASTDYAAEQGLSEANPLIGNDDSGRPNIGRLMATKLLVIATGTASIHALAKTNPRAARRTRALLVAALALISGNNIYQALQARAKAAAPAGAVVPTDRPGLAFAHTVTW